VLSEDVMDRVDGLRAAWRAAMRGAAVSGDEARRYASAAQDVVEEISQQGNN